MAKINMDGTKGAMSLIFIVTLNSQKNIYMVLNVKIMVLLSFVKNSPTSTQKLLLVISG